MRYTEDNFQAFLEELMQRIFVEYSKIGLSSERWKQSFTILTPDFGQKKCPEISEAKENDTDRKDNSVVLRPVFYFSHKEIRKMHGLRPPLTFA